VRPISTKMKGRHSMAQDAAFFAQLSHDANQVAAELIDTDEMLCEAEGRIQRLGEWMTEIEGNKECDPNLIEIAECQRSECEKSANAHTDRLNVLWQQLPRIEQSASSIDGYRIDQFPVMASIRNVAGRNQSHPISRLALELNRIADMAHREAERLWGPADSVKQLTYAATHCRNKAFNFVPNLRRKIEFIQGLQAYPERYKRPDEALQEARNTSEWVQHYSEVILRGAIADFNKAVGCKLDPLYCIKDATLAWHGRDLKVGEQGHGTACEAARTWCEIIRQTIQNCRPSLFEDWDHLKFLEQLLKDLEGLAVSDMSAEIDREEQATLKALKPKEPAQNDQASSPSNDETPPKDEVDTFIFRRDGSQYYVQGFGESGSFPNEKGFEYLYALLGSTNYCLPMRRLVGGNAVNAGRHSDGDVISSLKAQSGNGDGKNDESQSLLGDWTQDYALDDDGRKSLQDAITLLDSKINDARQSGIPSKIEQVEAMEQQVKEIKAQLAKDSGLFNRGINLDQELAKLRSRIGGAIRRAIRKLDDNRCGRLAEYFKNAMASEGYDYRLNDPTKIIWKLEK